MKKAVQRILFIDDNLKDHGPIKKAFMKRRTGSHLIFVRTAEAGLDIIEKEPVKALFVNKILPDMDGFAFLEELKKRNIRVPVIMMIGENDEKIGLKAIRKGAQDSVIRNAGYFNAFPFILDCVLVRSELDAGQSERERLIEASRRMWVATIDGIKDFIFIVDDEAKIFMLNQSLAMLVGKHPKELIGKNLKVLLGEDLSLILNKSKGNELFLTEEKTIRDETYLISSFPLQYDRSRLTIYVMKNISEMRRLKEQLYHTYKLASLGLLISGIAHELNNPMTGIITYAEFLRMKFKDGEINEGLNKILGGAERCKKIIDNLLTFSRQRMPAKNLESINDMIDRVIELRTYSLGEHNIEVVREYDDVPIAVLDSVQLQHVILNILMNAEQAIADSQVKAGRISFGTRYDRETEKITIKISDNGPGIPENIIPKIFDPFFTTKPVGTGTGLGLSIAHGVIAEHGGKIWVESSKNRGTAFFIEIPRTMHAADSSTRSAPLMNKMLKADKSKKR